MDDALKAKTAKRLVTDWLRACGPHRPNITIAQSEDLQMRIVVALELAE